MADVNLKTVRGEHISQAEVADLITDMAAKAAASDLATLSASVITLDGTVSANTTALAGKADASAVYTKAATESYVTTALDGVGGGETIGAVIPWGGIDLPEGDKHIWPDGSAISRTTYADLFAARTSLRGGDTTSGSAVVANIDTDRIKPGFDVEGAGIPAGATVASIDSATQLTLSANATATATGADLRFFAHGNGDGSSTFNIEDLRGRAIMGRDDMGGTAAGRLSNTGINGATDNPDGTRIGDVGGSDRMVWDRRGSFVQAGTGAFVDTPDLFDGADTTVGTGNTTDYQLSRLPPSMVLNFVVRALP